MDATDTKTLARSAAVNLSLNQEAMTVHAEPGRNLAPDLREAIKVNKEELIKDLLLKKALNFLGERGYPASGGDDDELNRSIAEDSPQEFREALREWTRERMEAGAEKAAKESVFGVHDYEGEKERIYEQ